MDFGSVLSRAWQIIWRHKVLWIFGILAGCGSNPGGNGSSFRYSVEGDQLPPRVERFFEQFNQLSDAQWALIAGLIILAILILVVIAVFLGTIGRVGLIRGTYQAESGETSLSFGELFNGSLRYFWRVFLLNLLVGIVIALVFIALAVFVILGSVLTMGIGALCLIPLFCLAVPAAWFVSLIVEQGSIAIVLEDRDIFSGLQRGWDVVRENLGAVIVMALILFVGVGLIGGFIIGLPLALIAAPAVIGLLARPDQPFGTGMLISGLCLVAYLPVLILLNGILRSYIESAWTLTFLNLTRRPALQNVEPSAAM